MSGAGDNFFSRWSRRKQAVRTGEPLSAEPVLAPVPEPAPVAVVPEPEPEPKADVEQCPPPPPPTLDDVARLTPQDDFSRFVARDVSNDVRNAAVKKLFADPHFNVMDGLDVYIDDYSQPSPLSAADMARMVGAQFLKLVDDPNEPQKTEQAEPVADAAAAPESPEPHDDHADLQLQPDHAPGRPAPGRGAG